MVLRFREQIKNMNETQWNKITNNRMKEWKPIKDWSHISIASYRKGKIFVINRVILTFLEKICPQSRWLGFAFESKMLYRLWLLTSNGCHSITTEIRTFHRQHTNILRLLNCKQIYSTSQQQSDQTCYISNILIQLCKASAIQLNIPLWHWLTSISLKHSQNNNS